MSAEVKVSSTCLSLVAMMLLAVGACGKKAEVKSSVTDLEKSLAAAAAPAPFQPLPNSASPTLQPEAHVLVRSAVAAVQSNNYVGGVIALEAALEKPGMTTDQAIAARRARQAMIDELQRRAVNGDQQALAQLKAIEKTRSQ